MRNIAICLRGIFIDPHYTHRQFNGKTGINAELCVENIYQNLINKFKLNSNNYKVYIFCAANDLLTVDYLRKHYKPHLVKLLDEKKTYKSTYEKVSWQIKEVITLVTRYKELKFDTIFCTRYDVLFDYRINFLQENINYDKFNFLCKCDDDQLVDDIFWCFSHKHLDSLIKVMNYQIDHGIATHYLSTFLKFIDFNDIHIMFPGNYHLATTRPLIKFLREI